MKISQSLLVLTGLPILFVACFGANNEALNAVRKEVVSKPFVEAFLEFLGPSEKWAGPQNFTIHISAHSEATSRAQISVFPSFFERKVYTSGGLAIAAQAPTVEVAREELARLSESLQGGDSQWQGCLLPVRVKLIRQDGVMVERQGCRGQMGWPRIASEVANRMIEYGMVAQNESSTNTLNPGVLEQVKSVDVEKTTTH